MLQPEDWPHVGALPNTDGVLTVRDELERKTTGEMLRLHKMREAGKISNREAILALTTLWEATAGLVDKTTMEAMGSMFKVAGPLPPPAAKVVQVNGATVITWIEGATVRVARCEKAAVVPCKDADHAEVVQNALIQKLAAAPAAAATV